MKVKAQLIRKTPVAELTSESPKLWMSCSHNSSKSLRLKRMNKLNDPKKQRKKMMKSESKAKKRQRKARKRQRKAKKRQWKARESLCKGQQMKLDSNFWSCMIIQDKVKLQSV